MDFAFAVHTDIGLRFKHAIVNGEIKPITFIPQTGDVIRIETFKNRYSANKHWADFLHTPGARASLLKFLKTQQKDDILKQVTNDFSAYLQNLHLPSLGSAEDLVKKHFEEEELEKRYMSIYDKKDTFSSLVKEVYPEQRKLHTQKQTKKPSTKKSVSSLSEVIVDGDPLLNYYFCPECKPQLGQKIIAKSGRDGLKIHTIECRSMKTVNFDKLLEAHWATLPE